MIFAPMPLRSEGKPGPGAGVCVTGVESPAWIGTALGLRQNQGVCSETRVTIFLETDEAWIIGQERKLLGYKGK